MTQQLNGAVVGGADFRRAASVATREVQEVSLKQQLAIARKLHQPGTLPELTIPGWKERILFIGSNGSGKTVLARAFLCRVPRYVVFDPKGDFTLEPGDVVVKKPTSIKWFLFKYGWFGINRIIYRPDPQYTAGMDLRLKWLFYLARRYAKKKKKNLRFVVYVDEGLFQATVGKTKWLRHMAITGRSFEVGLWLSAQRPRQIPVEVRSEAWRWYIFYTSYLEDDKEIIRYSKGQILPEDLQSLGVDHSFFELRRASGGRMQAVHFPPIHYEAA